MKNNIDGSDINVGSIDEDIEIVKNLIKILDKTCENNNSESARAIENVLSEVEEYQKHKKYHCEQLEKVLSEIESYKNRENKELETYKKIAEKLAEEISCIFKYGEKGPEYVLDEPRKEVEKDV